MTWAPQFYATKKLVVHHTATSDDYADRAGAEAQIRSIYYYHSVTQGWGDIGYNFLIDKFGNIYEGRYSRDYAGANPTGDDATGRGVTGAHTGGWNSGTVGVALLGTLTTHDATPAAREALAATAGLGGRPQRDRPAGHGAVRQPGERGDDHDREHRGSPRLRSDRLPGRHLLPDPSRDPRRDGRPRQRHPSS